MTNKYIQPGDIIDWVNGTGSAVVSGQPVVVGKRQMGIALVDIASTATGSVAREGVFQLAKNTAQAVTLGQRLFWNGSTSKVDNAATINTYFIGFAFAAQGSSDTTVLVCLEEFEAEGPRVLTLAATGAQTLNVGDFGSKDLIVFAPNTAAQTVNLPSVADISSGSKLFIRKTDATAQAITIDPAGSETIAGGATFATQDANNDLAQFVSTASAWVLMHSTIA
jgi:predicted RecA/RadA family phage recombinase